MSIVLVLYNRAALTHSCLQSIRETVDSPAEVIVVDNASTDATHRLLDRLDGARVIRNAENRHFLLACNQAARVAHGDYILLLNNDARLLPGSLRAAVTAIEHSNDIGVVGGKIVLLDGSLQEAGAVVWSDASCLGYGRGDSPTAPTYMFRRDVDYCSGAFFLVRRSLFEALGGFDEAFAPAYYEEVDFCLRAGERGFRTVYEPAAVILHYEFGSSDRHLDAIALHVRNQKILLERHPEIRARRVEAGRDRVLAARSVGQPSSRILLLADCVPHLDLGPGHTRSYEILTALVERGHFVTLYPLVSSEEPWDRVYTDVPREVEVMNGFGSGQLARFLGEREGYYHSILVRGGHNMETLHHAAEAALHALEGTRIVYEAEDVLVVTDASLAWARAADTVLVGTERERGVLGAHGIAKTEVLGRDSPPEITSGAIQKIFG